MSEARERFLSLMAKHAITVESKFIPWKSSRNKGQTDPTLNWTVSVLKNGKPVLTGDYSAGCANCPSYRQEYPKRWTVAEKAVIEAECNRGVPCHYSDALRAGVAKVGGKPILPDPADVVASFLSDGDAIDHPTYEDWAGEFGYDVDSRKGEAIYRACLQVGLSLRNTLGEETLRELREAAQDL
jgi:hypothetical protein